MGKTIFKVIKTFLLSMLLINVMGLLIRFFEALQNMDDELMFIYGFILMSAASSIFLFLFLSVCIANIWEKKNNKKEKNNER